MGVSIHPGDALSRRSRSLYVIVLGALTLLESFTIDLYLPAFPLIEQEFQSDPALVQLTLTATIAGFSVGQILVGPWSDRIGRRVPLVCATVMHVAASLGIALAPTIDVLIVLRFFQGAGASAGAVVALALVRDLFGGRPLVRILSRIALLSGLGPVAAPIVGAQLLEILPWRGMFAWLAVWGLLVGVAITVLITETLPPERRSTHRVRQIWRIYAPLLRDRVYVGVVLINALTFSGLLVYVSSSSFLIQGAFGFTAQQFGLTFAANSIAVMAGVQVSSLIARRLGPQWILAFSTAGLLAAACAISASGLLRSDPPVTLIAIWVFVLACGFTWPCTSVLSLAQHGSRAGTAASLAGAATFALGSLVASGATVIGATSATSMGAFMAATSLAAVLVLWIVVRPSTVPALVD